MHLAVSPCTWFSCRFFFLSCDCLLISWMQLHVVVPISSFFVFHSISAKSQSHWLVIKVKINTLELVLLYGPWAQLCRYTRTKCRAKVHTLSGGEKTRSPLCTNIYSTQKNMHKQATHTNEFLSQPPLICLTSPNAWLPLVYELVNG